MPKSTLVEHEAGGLPADWLNAWLAAIGVTVLLAEVKLSWSDDVVPHAVFWSPAEMDLPQAIFDAMPTEEALADSPIAPEGPGGKLGQKVFDSGIYEARAVLARENRDDALSSALTDLAHEDVGSNPTPVARGQFCVGMEGDETLWKRLVKCVRKVNSLDDPASAVRLSLEGAPTRVRLNANGLGFDPRRLPSGIGDPKATVDPVIETLVYTGTLAFPVRGDGGSTSRAAQKPWTRSPNGQDSLRYPVWKPALDRWAIDAYLDQSHAPRSGPSFEVRRLKPQCGTKKSAYFTVPVP